jgi:class 3 adenylate cyclase
LGRECVQHKKARMNAHWGGVVNMAESMASSGLPGALQAARSTRDLVAGTFERLPRGELEMKGKGRVETFLVVGEQKVA